MVVKQFYLECLAHASYMVADEDTKHVIGYLDTGMQVLDGRSKLVRQTPRITPQALTEALCTIYPPAVLDVRTEREHQEGKIDHSLNIPLPHLKERLHEIPIGQKLVVHCASGYRSSIAASILEKEQFRPIDLIGGYEAWEQICGNNK